MMIGEENIVVIWALILEANSFLTVINHKNRNYKFIRHKIRILGLNQSHFKGHLTHSLIFNLV